MSELRPVLAEELEAIPFIYELPNYDRVNRFEQICKVIDNLGFCIFEDHKSLDKSGQPKLVKLEYIDGEYHQEEYGAAA